MCGWWDVSMVMCDRYEASGSTAWDSTMNVSKRPAWIRSAETQVFERKKAVVSKVDDGDKDKQVASSGIGNDPNESATNEPRVSLNMEEGSPQHGPKAVPTEAATVIQEMKDAELSELTAADTGDALAGGDLNSVATLGNKNTKKNKVYAAPPVEDADFHEA